MTSFIISAPGRIVLSGEIGAMYGKQVVVASLNRRTELQLQELRIENQNIFIQFVDIETSLRIPLQLIVNFCSTTNFRTLISDHIQLRKRLQFFITANGMWKTHHQRFSLQIFFFLLMHIANDENLDIKPFRVIVSTTIPIGAGLGSSSSFAVCLSACFLHLARRQKGVYSEFDKKDLIRISNYAKLAEKVILNEMFESDIDVCCYGSVIKSRYNIVEDEYSFEKIDVPVIRVLLVDLNINFDMDERVMQIMTQKRNDSEKMNEYLNQSDQISEDICETLVCMNNFYTENSNSSGDEKEADATLQKLIQKYQNVLTALNLSHANLDDLINFEECSRKFEVSVGITFAGYRSKYAYILLTSHIKENLITKLKQCLQKKGLKHIDTVVTCAGLVKIDYK